MSALLSAAYGLNMARVICNASGAFKTLTLGGSHANWDHTIKITLQTNGALNLMGVLKGDVNRSWAATAGSTTLDIIDTTQFTALNSIFGMPVAQFGVV